MRIRFRYLLASLIVGGTLLLAFGCSQNDDVVRPQELATITLRPQNLPTLDTAHYVYELWMLAVDDDTHDSSFTSLGKFAWDNYEYSFKDLEGNKIDSMYEVTEPWLSYDYIVLTVENRHNDDPGPSGAYMLVDEVIDPVTRPIEMKFPVSMFDAKGYYFVATPSDDELDYGNEERGLWVCTRARSTFDNHDTLSVLWDSLDVFIVSEPDAEDSVKQDTVGIVWPPGSLWVAVDTFIVYGYDTLFHRRLNLEWVIDTVPESSFNLRLGYEVKTGCAPGDPPEECDYLGGFGYWNYTGPMEDIADIRPYGWRYAAWVLLEDQPAGDNSGLDLPRMSPFGYEGQQNFSGDTTWTVLSLGAFFRPDSADLSNPYVSTHEVPNYPGEDFIVDPPANLDNLNLRLRMADDATGGEFGCIIIGMEPIPTSSITVDTTRNFPLFVLSEFLPYYEYGPGLNPPFHNYSQNLPEIDVFVEIHE